MIDGTYVLFGVVGVLAANQIVLHLAGLYARRELFWGLQLVNVLMSVLILLVSVPGLPRAVHWFLALYLVYRTQQNTRERVERLRKLVEDEGDPREAKRQRVMDALRDPDDDQ